MSHNRLPDTFDIYMRLKHPEKYARAQQNYSDAFRPLLERIEVAAELEGTTLEQYFSNRVRETKRILLKRYHADEVSAAKVLGLSVDDLIDQQEAECARVRGGREGRTHHQPLKEIAVRAFIEVEDRGGTFTEALELADREIYRQANIRLDLKTLKDSWLLPLAKSSLTTMQTLKRGRPRKNTQ